ncbi:reverse transcriptase domain-containing protein, partial [Salmonella sp. s55044]|uniref:reverse transcriptase domain-containing protein n=1 Tax=Salmonella sp. s55044 TaxID=3159677 RepID=UPI00397F8831
MWATSIDLKDAYLHIPIHPNCHWFLAFHYIGGQDYQFTSLPFGLSTAPKVFTRVIRSVLSFLRRRGLVVFAFLDDWLIVSPSEK